MELSFWLAKFELPWVNLSQRPTLIVSQICVSTPLEDPLSLFACPVPLPLDFFPYSFSFSSGPSWNGYYVAHLQHSNNIHIYNFHSDFVLQVQILKSSCSSIVFHHHFWHLTSTQPNFNISYPGQLHVFLFSFCHEISHLCQFPLLLFMVIKSRALHTVVSMRSDILKAVLPGLHKRCRLFQGRCHFGVLFIFL